MNQDNILIIVLFCIITFLILYKDLDKKIKNSLLIISILYILYLVLNKVQNLENERKLKNFSVMLLATSQIF